jgi:hypothetical protein
VYRLGLGRALSKARAGRGWEGAALSEYAHAARLAGEAAGGLLMPLVKLHGTRLRVVAAAARLLARGGDGGGAGAEAVSEAARLLRLAARHCFGANAAARLAALPAAPSGAEPDAAARRGGGRRRRAGSGSDGGSDGSGDGGGGGPAASAAALAPALEVLSSDAADALRFCQARYSQPGQLHTAAYRLARGLALLGRCAPWRVVGGALEPARSTGAPPAGEEARCGQGNSPPPLTHPRRSRPPWSTPPQVGRGPG